MYVDPESNDHSCCIHSQGGTLRYYLARKPHLMMVQHLEMETIIPLENILGLTIR